MNASFEEKSVWITLSSLVATFAIYFALAARMLSAGVMIVAPYVALLAVATVLLAVGVLAAIVGLALGLGAAWIANGLLMSLFLSEVLKQVMQLVYYRRGV